MTTAPPPPHGSLAAALLIVLAEEGGGQARAVSLPRLGKRLEQGVSALLRELALMGSTRIGPYVGPGWVSVEQDGERWRARLTPAGIAAAAAVALLAPDSDD